MRKTNLISSLLLAASAPLCSAALQLVEINSGVTNDLNAAAASDNGSFVVAGTNRTILRGRFSGGDVNRIIWEPAALPSGSISLLAATYGNGVFLAGGSDGKVITSPDGLQWAGATNPFPNTAYIMGLAHNPRSSTPRFAAAAAAVQIAYSPAAGALSWKGGIIDQFSFVESFRGLAPFGQNGFAACGIAGDIRVSTNGGGNWLISRVLQSSQPNLLGIASDGNTRLVAVGAGGTIWHSPDGWTGWAQRNPVSATLRAVAYNAAQSQFVVVGDQGNLLTSADGLSWSQHSTSFAGSLRGVTFGAANTPLAGVGVLVGDNGKVFLAGEPPPIPGANLASDKVYCAGSAPLPLEVIVNTSASNPEVTVDWYAAPTGGAILPGGQNTAAFFPDATNAPPNEPIITTYFAQARDRRTGIINPQRVGVTLTVNPRPKAVVRAEDGAVICNGEARDIRADLTGIGPWTVTWSDGFTQTTNALPSSGATVIRTVAPANYSLNQASNYTYTVTAVADANCAAEPGDLTSGAAFVINPRPTAVARAADGATICNGEAREINADLTGIGPWIVTWSDGYVQTNLAAGAGPQVVTRTVAPANFSLNEASNYTYTVTAVIDVNCAAQVVDLSGGIPFTINPRPTAALASFTATNCNLGTAYTLTNILTGLGPWVVTWSDGVTQTSPTAGPGPVVLTRTVVPFAPELNQASNNVFSVATVVTDNGCAGSQAGDINGTVAIRIDPRPTASLASFAATNCNTGTPYTLTNTLTGLGPWVVTWNDGFVQTNAETGAGPVLLTRTVVPATPDANQPSNNVFSVVAVANGNGCVNVQPGDLSGEVSILVNPRPTASMASLNATNCNLSAPYTLTNTLTGFGPWVVTWNDGLVQTQLNAGPGPVTLNRTVVPFTPDLNQASNNVFSVVSVTDANGCAASQAGDIAGQASIWINPRPTASLTSFGATNCNLGAVYTLTNTLTGLGPWMVTWSDGMMQTNLYAGPGPVLFTRDVIPVAANPNLASKTVYQVTSVATFNGCSSVLPEDLSGQVVIRINPRPTSTLASLAATNCNVGLPYTLTNTLTGLGPWTVTWNDGFVQSSAADIAGPFDLIRVVVPTNPDLNMPSNNTFFVTSVTTPNGCSSAQLGDIAGQADIWVNPRPTAALTPVTATACNVGAEFTLTNTLTGQGPWIVAWADGFMQTNFTAGPGPATLLRTVIPTNTSLTLPSNNVYQVSAVSDANACAANSAADISGTASITVIPRPTAAVRVADSQIICNGDSAAVHADLTGLGAGPWVVTWASNDVVVAVQTNSTGVDALTVSPYNPDPLVSSQTRYTVAAVRDASCVARANDLRGFALVTVRPRVTAVVSGSTTIPNGAEAIVRANLTGEGPWEVTWASNGVVVATHSVPTSPDTLPVRPVNPNLDQPASFVYTVVDVRTLDCVAAPGDLTGQATIQVDARPTATVVTTNTICNGEATTVLAQLSGAGPWTVAWASNSVVIATHTNVVGPTDTLSVQPVNPYPSAATNVVYTVAALSDTKAVAVAADLKGLGNIIINPRPAATVRSADSQSICNGDSANIRADLTGLGSGPWVVTWASNGVVVATHTNATGIDSLTVSTYNPDPVAASMATYTVSQLSDAHCVAQPSDLKGLAVITTRPRVTASVSGSATVANGAEAMVRADLTGEGPWEVTWASNGVVIATQQVDLSPAIFPVRPFNPNPETVVPFIYTVVEVKTLDCAAAPADLAGQAVISVNPRPSATVSGANTLCNGETTTVQAILTGFGPWNVTWASNGVAIITHTNVAVPTDTLTVQPVNPDPSAAANVVYTVLALTDRNTAALPADLMGAGVITVNPRPAATVRSSDTRTICNGETATVRADLTGLGSGPWILSWASNGVVVAVQTNVTGVASLEVSPANPNSIAGSVTVYTIAQLSDDHCAAQAGDLKGLAAITVRPRVTASLSGSDTLCSGETRTLRADLTGEGPWDVTWSSNGVPVITRAGVESNVDTLTVTLAHSDLDAPLVVRYAVSALSTLDCTAQPADLASEAVLTVNAVPASPVSLGDLVSCSGATNPPLAVTVTGPAMVDWFATPTGGSAVFTNTTSITFGNYAPGVYTYYAEARSAAGCRSASRTPVTLELKHCQLLSIQAETNGAALKWFGKLDLYSAPLVDTSFAQWVLLTNGVAGETNSYVVPDHTNGMRYFRLVPPQ